jgi:hypothetical protein
MARRRNRLLLEIVEGIEDWATASDDNVHVLAFTFLDATEDLAAPWLDLSKEEDRCEKEAESKRHQGK